jgi:transcription termination/antitermination protein NusG
MQKNWYIIYTKAKCEKKVASIFTKKRIENFIPLNSKSIAGKKKKMVQEPLFKSMLFAKVQEDEITKIRMIDNVINVLYWKETPVIIQKAEIDVIREFTFIHQDIVVEKIPINVNYGAKVIDGARYIIDGNILTVKNTNAKVNLPSIGYALIAKVETETGLNTGVSFGKRDLLLQ